MRYSTAITSEVYENAKRHLLSKPGQEELCFAVWHPSDGSRRKTALIERIILPIDGERLLHGNAGFLPQYYERAISECLKSGGGLAFLHSHIGPGWQGMSSDDIRAEQGHASSAKGATGLPLIGLTIGTDGALSARFWEKTSPRKYDRKWCESVRVVGNQMLVTYDDGQLQRPKFKDNLSRTISSWGEEMQSKIARMHIGIVGAGSVGTMVAESLARMGISTISIFDFDTVENVNLDRLLHASEKDARLKLAKVDVLKKGLKKSATSSDFTINGHEWSVAEEEGFREALNCDVLFSCVDRPWPRMILNFISYAHLIPVVDGGIRVEMKKRKDGLKSADWRAHIAAPGRPCLECLGQFNSGDVSAEREGFFDNPHYIQGLDDNHLIKRNENVFAFSMSAASFEILQFLSMVIAPMGIYNPSPQIYHFTTGKLDSEESRRCSETCPYPKMAALGEHSTVKVTGKQKVAEDARILRKRYKKSLRYFWNKLL